MGYVCAGKIFTYIWCLEKYLHSIYVHIVMIQHAKMLEGRKPMQGPREATALWSTWLMWVGRIGIGSCRCYVVAKDVLSGTVGPVDGRSIKWGQQGKGMGLHCGHGPLLHLWHHSFDVWTWGWQSWLVGDLEVLMPKIIQVWITVAQQGKHLTNTP